MSEEASKKECIELIQSLYSAVKRDVLPKWLPTIFVLTKENSSVKMVMLDESAYIVLKNQSVCNTNTDYIMTFNVGADDIVTPKENVKVERNILTNTSICDDEEIFWKPDYILTSAKELYNRYSKTKGMGYYKQLLDL